MWEWIPENLSTVLITAEYNGTITTNLTRVIYQETDVILELEHAQKYGLNNRLYMQLFSISKIGYFEPAYAPYRIQIARHNGLNNHTTLTEWTGLLDNHGYKGFYVDLADTSYTTIDYEVHCYIYNNTGNESGEYDVLIDSDGGTTQGRAEQFEAGTYLSFYDVYGPNSNLWWYNDTDDDNFYDVDSDTVEGLNWSHTVQGDINLVGVVGPDAKKLSTANNYKNIFFNDTNENEVWDNDTGESISEDIWLDNGNGIWDNDTEQTGYPYEGYNGTPFLRMFHTIEVIPGTSYGKSTNITANKWIWLGYLNGSGKTGATLHSQFTNCSYLVMQNATGYYYTYGGALKEDFTITYGSAICVLVTTDQSWDHK